MCRNAWGIKPGSLPFHRDNPNNWENKAVVFPPHFFKGQIFFFVFFFFENLYITLVNCTSLLNWQICCFAQKRLNNSAHTLLFVIVFLIIFQRKLAASLHLHLFVNPSIHSCIHPSSIYICLCLSISIYLYLCIYLPVSIHQCTHSSIHPSSVYHLCPSIHLTTNPSIHLSILPSNYLFIYPSTHPSIWSCHRHTGHLWWQ